MQVFCKIIFVVPRYNSCGDDIAELRDMGTGRGRPGGNPDFGDTSRFDNQARVRTAAAPMNQQVKLLVDADTKRWLEDEAKARELSMADVVREAIAEKRSQVS